MDANEGLDHGKDDEQSGQNLEIFPLRCEIQHPEYDRAAVKSSSNAVKEENDGEGDHGEGEAVEDEAEYFGGH